LARFAARDLTLRYRQTFLGIIWVVLQPLLGAAVLSFVFGTVAGVQGPPGVPYFVFTFTGMTAFNLFSTLGNRASFSLIGNASMIQKVFFPRLLLPLSTLLSTLVDLGVSVAVLVVLLVANGIWAGAQILLFPAWLLLFAAMGMGVGLVAASLTVRYRDVQYILPVTMQFLLFASPIAYSVSGLGKRSWFFALNPLTGALEGVRWSVLGTTAPSLGATVYSVFAGVVAMLAGLVVFSRMERQFADVI
jgi:lipopolysaccharide transport system permease protein